MPEGKFRESHGRHSSWRRYQYDGRRVWKTGGEKSGWLESVGKVAKSFCSSITGTLATLAVLKGVGVGDSTATPLAATITWMLKDGTGMLGRILFAWLCGTDLDCFSKQWRLVADALNDLAILLNLIAPLFPGVFLFIACFASLCRAIVGVAGNATRAAFVQHQARRNNMADVAAKDGSQETLMNLVGLIVNLIIIPTVASSQSLIWLMFVVFTALHLWANYCAVTVLCMETLNKNRLHVVVQHYLKTGDVLTPKQANAQEPVLRRIPMRLNYSLGCPLSKALQSATNDYIRLNNYMFIPHSGGHKVSVCLHEESDRKDQLRAALTVECAEFICTSGMTGPVLTHEYAQYLGGEGNALKMAQSIMDKSCEEFISALSTVGWVTSHVLLGAEEWRYSWSPDKNT
ncbi:RUS family member 1-like isoform X2 [Halichondria panicea]|uniref:RUS family member 1-like isoform X2 n=1 Tax=Halichondria panicea TaxID=6063 RepID=UPI00312B7A15